MKFLPLIIILTLLGCNKKSKLQLEVDEITDCDQLKLYLQQIDSLDQVYRSKEDDVNAQFGYGSDEHNMIWELINLTDELNRKRIDLVFKKFDYPSIECVGTRQARTPLMVLHHTLDYNEREEYFPMLYTHFKADNLEAGLFMLFLDRMYIFKHGTYLKITGSYKEAQKIDTLISRLNLIKPT